MTRLPVDQLALLPAPDRPAPPPRTYWRCTGPRRWVPVTEVTRYGDTQGERPAPLPDVTTGGSAPRNIAVRHADGQVVVVPVRTLRVKEPSR